ncbi:MAG: sigma-70 family RNA polymerase sigma factor [Caldisericia bacterium]
MNPQYLDTLYLEKIKKIKKITEQEIQKLMPRARKGDIAAASRIAEGSMPLVLPIAKRYCVPGIPLFDLIQEGNNEIVRVMKNNAANKGYFSNYMSNRIRNAILRYCSFLTKKLCYSTDEFEYLTKNLAHDGTQEPILYKIKTSDGRRVTEKQKERVSLIQYLKSVNQINYALNKLTAKEKKVTMLRLGLYDELPYTLKCVGEKMKITASWVGQIEDHAFIRIRQSAMRLKFLEKCELEE